MRWLSGGAVLAAALSGASLAVPVLWCLEEQLGGGWRNARPGWVHQGKGQDSVRSWGARHPRVKLGEGGNSCL